MKHYTIVEFRKNIREATKLADEGEEVVIHKYGKVYILKVPNVPSNYLIPKTAPLISEKAC